MIKFIKNNKILSILLFLTLITIIIGIITYAMIDNNIKKDINTNILNLKNNIKTNKLITLNIIKNKILGNTLLNTFIWLFGVSIIGIPIILILYLSKVYILSLETISLLMNIKNTSILFIIVYLIPNIINLLIMFFLVYYSISYSSILIKLLFLKKEYNIKKITKRYIKILLITTILILISTLIDIFIIPKILKFLI